MTSNKIITVIFGIVLALFLIGLIGTYMYYTLKAGGAMLDQ